MFSSQSLFAPRSTLFLLPNLIAIYPHNYTDPTAPQCYNGFMLNHPDGQYFLNALNADVTKEKSREFIIDGQHYFLETNNQCLPYFWIDYIFLFDEQDMQRLQNFKGADSQLRSEKPVFFQFKNVHPFNPCIQRWENTKLENSDFFSGTPQTLSAFIRAALIKVSHVSLWLDENEYSDKKLQPSKLHPRC